MDSILLLVFVFFNDTATTEIYTLSLHDALPISDLVARIGDAGDDDELREVWAEANRSGMLQVDVPTPSGSYTVAELIQDRKSTRLNSSHANISYAVFCLKKKNERHSPSSRRHHP